MCHPKNNSLVMYKTQHSFRKLWLALALLSFAYGLLGWYLAAHHLIWLIGAVVIGAALLVDRQSARFLANFAQLGNQSLVMVFGASFLFTLFVTALVLKPLFLSIVILPVLTMLFADLELRVAGVKPINIALYLAMIAAVSLGIGEFLDLFYASPSLRF